MSSSAGLRRIEEAIASRRHLYVIALFLFVLGETLSAVQVVGGPHVEFAEFARGGTALLIISLVGGFVVLVSTRPTKRELTSVLVLGALFEAAQLAWRISQHQRRSALILNTGGGLGIAGLLVAIVSVFVVHGPERRRRIWRLSAIGLFPTFMFLSRVIVDLTRTLDPLVSDPAAYVADSALGVAPSFTLSLALRSAHLLFVFVYFGIPLAAALIQVQQLRHPERSRDDIGFAFIFTGLIGGLLYNVVPTMGPAFLFHDAFPFSPPDPTTVPLPSVLTAGGNRNGIPSLHTTWALLIFWQSRPHAKWVRVFAGVFLVLTLGATMALGEHYVTDLIVSVPFAVGMNAALASTVSWRAPARWVPVAAGTAYFIGWSALLLGAPSFFLRQPGITRALFVLTVVPPLFLHRALVRAKSAASLDLPADVADPVQRGSRGVIVALAAASGLAALIATSAFTESLALVFGSRPTATTTVLVTTLAGIGLGAWLGGRVASRSAQPLRLYAHCQGGTALACAATPWLLGMLRAPYVAFARGIEPGSPWLASAQMLLGGAVLLVPAVLVGVALVALAKEIAPDGERTGAAVGLLLTASTFGAAAGALAAGYVLLQFIGVFATTLVAGGVGLVAAFAALRMAPTQDPGHVGAASGRASADGDKRPLPSREACLGLLVLGVGGAVTLCLEGTYTHLLGIVAGSSVFALAGILSSFLLGLGAGTALGRGWLRRALSPVLGIGIAYALVAATVLVGVFGWSHVPPYFAAYANYPLARGFASREVVRFAVCMVEMFPVALFVGATFPLAVECACGASPDRATAAGRVIALGALGGAAGALVCELLLLPAAGSLHAVQLVACASVALSLAAVFAGPASARKWLAIPTVAGALAFVGQPRAFDLTVLTAGASVYFNAPRFGEVVDDAEGAKVLATVNRSERDGQVVQTLVANGAFVTDDSPRNHIGVDGSFPLLPLLHTTRRSRALVAGLGTGATAKVLADAGFGDIDIAEPSGEIARLSARHFESVSGRVLERTNVHLHITGARNQLMVDPGPYDVVTVDLAPIWSPDVAALYVTDFYRLVASRLATGGVLAETIPYDHLRVADAVAVLASIRLVFPTVWLYEVGEHGVLVACSSDCEPTPDTVAKLDSEPALTETLALVDGRARGLLARRVLAPESVDQLLVRADARIDALAESASTDDQVLLEYSAPRGNLLSRNKSVLTNSQMYGLFRPGSELTGTRIAAERAD